MRKGLRKCAWHERARACGAWHAQANVRAVRAGWVRVRFMCVRACVVCARKNHCFQIVYVLHHMHTPQVPTHLLFIKSQLRVSKGDKFGQY